MKFDAPIPGSSLTKEPSNSPWEQPPLYAKQEDALAFYLDRLSDGEVVDDIMFALERKFPLSVIVDSMTSIGVMEGYHTIDVKMLIAPVLHEHIKMLAETLGVRVVESDDPSKEDAQNSKAKQRMLIMLEEALNNDENTPLTSDNKQQAAQLLQTNLSDTPPVPVRRGLIPRRT